jgi:hypothetical protein
MEAPELKQFLLDEIDASSARFRIPFALAGMRTMTLGVMVLMRFIPTELRFNVALGVQRWYGVDLPSVAMKEARVICWNYLREKNSSKMRVVDDEDRAIRALICILWDDPGDDAEMEFGIEAYVEFVWRFDCIDSTVFKT